jgi:hypothetical protein
MQKNATKQQIPTKPCNKTTNTYKIEHPPRAESSADGSGERRLELSALSAVSEVAYWS